VHYRRKKNKSDNCTTVLCIVAMRKPVNIQRHEPLDKKIKINKPLDKRGNAQINHLNI